MVSLSSNRMVTKTLHGVFYHKQLTQKAFMTQKTCKYMILDGLAAVPIFWLLILLH